MDGKVSNITIEQLREMIDLVCPCTDDYLYLYDLKNDYYYISPHAIERFCIPDYEFNDVAKNHEKFVHPEDLDMLLEDLDMMVKGVKNFHNLQYRWLGVDKQPIWINCRGRTICDNEGKPAIMLGCINEIGKKQKADNNSGLLVESSLRMHIQTMEESKLRGFMLRIGIDDFKDINENLGIEYGDKILRETANCISSVIMPGQNLYRIVADEFMIVDFLGGTEDDAYGLYKRIRQSVDQFIERNCYEAVYTISGGVLGITNLEDCSYLNIMKLSEFALSEAKRNGKNRCCIYNNQDYQKFLRRRELIHQLRHAVHHDFQGFDTHFQPVVDPSNNHLIGAETLLRFSSEKTGAVSPMEFIPVLEETGLIIPVGKWVLHRALAVCREWQEYIPGFKISVNLSYIQVMKSPILTEILTSVRQYGLEPEDVIIELTESGFLESNYRCIDLWNRLRRNGITLALDDFGTGYSNFHYLYELSPNIIKIDRTFTDKALHSEYEYNLLAHIVDMVRSIDLKLCIEGIETGDELNSINRLKPDYIQGYYYGKPCAYQDFCDTYMEEYKDKS